MSNTWFQFKQFRITQERSALKVGTDGVLLGAWCRSPEKGEEGEREREDDEILVETQFMASPNKKGNSWHFLDVGTGTGLIALMLAQRSEAEISAIEINPDACEDAKNNFQNSPWKERLILISEDFNQFSRRFVEKFDLVVSNPPYFKQSLRSKDQAASVARHDVSLSFLQLVRGAKAILTDSGRLAVIIPFEAFDDFRETARLSGFFMARKTLVIPKAGKAPKRVLLEFSVKPVYPVDDELVILKENGGYSDSFISLTKDFYLNL